MTIHYLQHAAPQGWVPKRGRNECSRYPSAEITCDTIIDSMAAHRCGINSRILDFRDCKQEPIARAGLGQRINRRTNQEGVVVEGAIGLNTPDPVGWRNQQSLWQYYHQEMHDTLEAGDEMYLIVIPPCYDWRTLYLKNEVAVEGLSMTVRAVCADVDLGVIDGATLGCSLIDVPADLRMREDQNEIISVVIDAFPPANEDKCLRPITHGKLGDAAFMVSADYACISSGK